MDKQTRNATLILIADLLTVSTAGYITVFATTMAQKDWLTAIMSFLLAVFTGCATIYFRRQV